VKRRELREHIFQLLFRIEFHDDTEMPEQMKMFFEDIEKITIGEKDREYIENKYSNMKVKLEEIDRSINEIAEGWKTNRMSKVDLTLIRLAVYEMKYDEEVPVNVAINEAVELAKKFGQDESPSFVNGILAKLA
jgi:N utilization substance protein B